MSLFSLLQPPKHPSSFNHLISSENVGNTRKKVLEYQPNNKKLKSFLNEITRNINQSPKPVFSEVSWYLQDAINEHEINSYSTGIVKHLIDIDKPLQATEDIFFTGSHFRYLPKKMNRISHAFDTFNPMKEQATYMNELLIQSHDVDIKLRHAFGDFDLLQTAKLMDTGIPKHAYDALTTRQHTSAYQRTKRQTLRP